MKKYLTLFVVLAMTSPIYANVARGDVAATPNASIGAQARLKTQAVLKIKSDEMQATMKTERAQAQTKIAALKASIKNEKDGIKEKIEELRITGRENALQRFDGAVEKINNLNDRVNAQITKLEGKGIDVTDAKNFEATVKTSIVDVKTKIADASTLLSTSIKELTAEDKANLKTLAKDIQTLLNDAHTALNSAVKSLKDAIAIKK